MPLSLWQFEVEAMVKAPERLAKSLGRHLQEVERIRHP